MIMLKFLLVIAIIVSAIGIYAIGFDDFIKLILLLIQKLVNVIIGWFKEGQEELIP